MFEINTKNPIKKEIVDGSPVYVIDNFYQNPDQVLEVLFSVDPKIWKEDQSPSFNQVFFDDRRHFFKFFEIKKVYTYLSGICNQPALKHNKLGDETILTNFINFKPCAFNDYKNNYWWPHKDMGYNAIVYLNKEESVSGTNLYINLNPDQEPPDHPEHYRPWRNKNNFKLIKTIHSKYNRMVLFDGLKFTHGMNICDEEYFKDSYRINQVFFFKDPSQELDNED